MNFTLAELTKISLEPGEVLAVKLYGDDYDEEHVAQLRAHLKSLFPQNNVLMFVLPNGTDLQMEKISAKLEDKENSAVKDCSQPTSYCNDCSCGKKERIEGE